MALKSNFFEDVYEVVKLVPYGRVTTYGAIAYYLGTPRNNRMVGWALHQAVHLQEVPAHRVVNRKGLLTGKHHFVGNHAMEELLAEEGVVVRNNQIQDFEKVFWNPIQIEQVLT